MPALHPDLHAHLRRVEGGARAIYHPLVVALYCGSDAENAYFNERLAAQRQVVLDRCRAGRWRSAVLHHAKPFRLQAFLLVRHHLVRRPEVYWSFLRVLWEDSETVQHELPIWERLLLGRHPRAGREHLMYPFEREALAAMPERLTVYHGLERPPSLALGWSWTLDRRIADRFARRFAARAVPAPVRVASGVVRKADVLAYLATRCEEEILVPPQRVEVRGIEDLRQRVWMDYDAHGNAAVFTAALDDGANSAAAGAPRRSPGSAISGRARATAPRRAAAAANDGR